MATKDFFDVIERDGVSIVRLENPQIIDQLIVHEMGDQLVAFAENGQPERAVINFERVTHCTSEVIGAIIRFWRRLAQAGAQMKLSNMNAHVRDLFRIMRLDGTVFEIYDSEDDALTSFKSQ